MPWGGKGRTRLVGELDEFAALIVCEEPTQAMRCFRCDMPRQGTERQAGDEDDLAGAIDQTIDNLFGR
ncbi:hypothetical protein AZKH_4125 [Azoarcus sp. KH32C]|nr:hypothetical protein AZKH_4125 [Azoarcus sp. KH32C]